MTSDLKQQIINSADCTGKGYVAEWTVINENE